MPTKERQEHFEKICELGCIVCLIFKDLYSPPVIHHNRKGLGMRQRDDNKVIGLCPMHHDAGGPGVAIHASQKEFESRYGTEQQLLDETNKRLGIS